MTVPLSDIKLGKLMLDTQASLKQAIASELKRRISIYQKDLNHDDWRTFCELFNPHQEDSAQESEDFLSMPLALFNEYLDEYNNEIEELIHLDAAMQKSHSSLLQKESLFRRPKHPLDASHSLSGAIEPIPKRRNLTF